MHVFKNVYCSSCVGNPDGNTVYNIGFPELPEMENRKIRAILFFTSLNLNEDANGQTVTNNQLAYYLTLIDHDGNYIFQSVPIALFSTPASLGFVFNTDYRFQRQTNVFKFKPRKISFRSSFLRCSTDNVNQNIPFLIDYD